MSAVVHLVFKVAGFVNFSTCVSS